MKTIYTYIFILTITLLLFPFNIFAKSWKFIKEEDGIKLFYCLEPNKKLKLFRTKAIIEALTAFCQYKKGV